MNFEKNIEINIIPVEDYLAAADITGGTPNNSPAWKFSLHFTEGQGVWDYLSGNLPVFPDGTVPCIYPFMKGVT